MNIEDLAREAGLVDVGGDGSWMSTAFDGDDIRAKVTCFAALVRAAALDETAALCDGFVWFEVEGCGPDEAPKFLAAAIRALKDKP
jgi:hypothetical protein